MILRQLLFRRRGALPLSCRSPWQRTRPSSSIPSTFDGMVPPFWVERLRSRGFAAPTEIQAVALPLIMPTTGSDGDAVPGRSAVLQAETGTGKTLCYLLPMLEHLRQQLAANALPGADPRVTPSGLVIVPTRELAAQVHAIASSLMPEAARFMRIISGSAALGASQEVGIIISTPVALETNVHFRHLLFVRSVVLDEADMLLSGAFRAAVQGYVLARFKQRMPEDRPQQLFCGATVPCSGTKSVAAFLDKYYAPPAVLRISTPGCHRALPRIAHTFIQIDAAVPLTQLERASQELLQRRAIDELRAQEILAEVGMEVADEMSEETTLTGDEGAEVTESAPRDAVAHEMRRRALEDNAADLRADHADYVSRVVGLRLHVLLEALLLPSRIAEGDQRTAATIAPASRPATPPPPTESSPSVSSPSEALNRGSRAARRRSRVDILGLSNGMPVARGRAPADATDGDARKDRARDPKVAGAQATPESAPPSALSLEDIAKPLIVPLATPTALRTGLTADECALVPATLVFVNSSTAAVSMRKSLKAAAPELQ